MQRAKNYHTEQIYPDESDKKYKIDMVFSPNAIIYPRAIKIK